MAKCDSKGFVVRADQIGKLKNEDMIAISVLDTLASCAKIDTRNNNEASNAGLASGAFYNAANVPVDAFGCSKNSCYNTGTYQGVVAADKTSVTIGDFKKTFDGTLYATGIITVYVLLPDGDYTVTANITDYTEPGWTNYETYTKTVHATKGNSGTYLYPVQFDMSQAPASETGDGWTPSTVGAKIRFTISGLKAADNVGISSIAFYEGIEDLELNKTILVTCIDTWGDSQSFDVVEGACSTSEYDPQSGSITFNLTANKWTDNLKFINPTLRKTDDTEFGTLNIVTRTVADASSIDSSLAGYGFVQLSDMAEEDCGYVYIQTPGCAGNSHDLTRVNAPVPVINKTTDADKFQVLTTDFKGDLSRGLILVGADWIGQDLNIVYRKAVTAEVYEVTNEFRDFNVSILAPLRKKDGSIEWHIYENAFVTTVPNNISRSDETTVELEFTVAADENGVRKKIAKILDN